MNHLERMYRRMKKRESKDRIEGKKLSKLQVKIWSDIAKKCEVISELFKRKL